MTSTIKTLNKKISSLKESGLILQERMSQIDCFFHEANQAKHYKLEQRIQGIYDKIDRIEEEINSIVEAA